MKHRMRLAFALATLALSLWSIPSRADSQARIVRLSDIRGDVEIDRDAGQGFEKAVLNVPVVQGTKLRAGYDGYAEVEFEDSTTVRITPGTTVEFPRLVLHDSGAKATTVAVLEGIAYVTYAGTKGDDFLLTFDDEKVPLVKEAHIRLEMGHTKARLSVFSGDMQVETASGTVEVKKKRAVVFALNDEEPPTAPSKLAKIQSDGWDSDLEQYHEQYGRSGVYRQKPGFSSYGFSDLVYFGSFYHDQVCGLVWRPYLVNASWDPFAAGGWAWYPGSGYSWVSAYPWGWLPYHYGSWQMCSGNGWAWQPSQTWRGLDNCPNPRRHPHVFPPVHPPVPTETGKAGVAEGHGLRNIPFPVPVDSGMVIVRRNSAGLGVPRGAVSDLRGVSRQVERRGSAGAVVYQQQAGPGAGTIYTRGAATGSYASSSSHQQGTGSHSGTVSMPHSNVGSSASVGHSSQQSTSAPAGRSSGSPAGPK